MDHGLRLAAAGIDPAGDAADRVARGENVLSGLLDDCRRHARRGRLEQSPARSPGHADPWSPARAAARRRSRQAPRARGVRWSGCRRDARSGIDFLGLDPRRQSFAAVFGARCRGALHRQLGGQHVGRTRSRCDAGAHALARRPGALSPHVDAASGGCGRFDGSWPGGAADNEHRHRADAERRAAIAAMDPVASAGVVSRALRVASRHQRSTAAGARPTRGAHHRRDNRRHVGELSARLPAPHGVDGGNGK